MARLAPWQKDFQRYPHPLAIGDVDRPVATVWYGAKEALEGLVI
jgi:hypothetical protein